MIVIGTAAAAAGKRIEVPIENDRIAGKTDWLACGQDPELSPTVFLAELPPQSALGTHFHRENQFQLFVQGEGSIGPHPLGPITVHYAGAYTGYGPLVAGPQGVAYFTIRPVYDTGAHYMPGARDAMVRGPKRHLQSEPVAPIDAEALRTLRAVECIDLIALQPDAIAARLVRLPPQATHVDLDPHGSGGQFIVVVGGSIAHGDRALGRLDMLFVSADEPAFALHAGDEGAEVVLMQLPVKAQAYVGHGWSHAMQAAGSPKGEPLPLGEAARSAKGAL
jgi:hypothetical protein